MVFFIPENLFSFTLLCDNCLICSIQAQCWPILASGRDVIGIGETGSGKTLAFTIPALAHLQHRTKTEGRASKGSPRMLIIAPTRELAMQSQEVLEAAGKECGIASVCVYGGVSKWGQKEALGKGVEVVVATPGRLIDLMQEEIITLSQVFPVNRKWSDFFLGELSGA